MPHLRTTTCLNLGAPDSAMQRLLVIVAVKIIPALVLLLLLVGAVEIASGSTAIALPGSGLIISGWRVVIVLAIVEGLLVLALWWLFAI